MRNNKISPKLPPFVFIVSLNMEQWDTIYKKNASKILGICRRYVKNHQQAEDLMHTTFITAMDKADTYSGKGLFEGWLRKIAVNTALLYLRSNKKSIISENELNENYSETIPEQENSYKTQRNIIEEADFGKEELLEVIDQLPDHHKTVFNLYVIDGYKHYEIGKMLNISPGTSKSHLARARKKIQQLLFEKAENKDKKRAFFFLFFPKENYIDKLYKDAFQNFEIQAQTDPQFENGSKFVNTHQNLTLFNKIFGKKVAFISSIGIIITISVFAVFFLYPQKVFDKKGNSIKIEPVTNEKQNSIEPIVKFDNAIIEPDAQLKTNSNLKETNIPVQSPKESSKPLLIKTNPDISKNQDSVLAKKPFVVHKSIIQHDTVIKKVPVSNEK